MPETDTLNELRSRLDYDSLIAKASPALQLYIRTLEQDNARLRQEIAELQEANNRRQRAEAARKHQPDTTQTQTETIHHADDVMVISVTVTGQCKRTPLNDYAVQRRGGVGVFDILTSRDDQASRLLVARATANLLLLTDHGRAFRVPVHSLPLTEVRGRGTSLPDRLPLASGESIGALLALDDELDPRSYVLIATSDGWVRRLRRNYVGPHLQPGTQLCDPLREGGTPVAMSLSSGNADILLALRGGAGIRFDEQTIRRDAVHGIQVKPGDTIAGITSVQNDDAVLLVTADGKGTRRLMNAFRANKTPGGQGKVLMKTDALVGAVAVSDTDSVLCLSAQAKIIHFAATELPTTAGTVQGNNIMDCRGSNLTAIAVVPAP